MEVAVIGGSGGLGQKICDLIYYGYEFIPHSSKEIDVTDIVSCENFFNFLHPDIRVVINLAGFNYDCKSYKINQDNHEHLKRIVDVNAMGCVNVISAALPGMIQRRYGRIINISSILSEINIPGTSVYSASKAFIDKFVQTSALEVANNGVTINSIQLGYFDAGLTHKLPDRETAKQTIPMKRFGRIEELITTIQFLIQQPYITGTNIKLAGGL